MRTKTDRPAPEPKAPKAPKAPRTPKVPRIPKTPWATKAPKAPKAPRTPKAPKPPRARRRWEPTPRRQFFGRDQPRARRRLEPGPKAPKIPTPKAPPEPKTPRVPKTPRTPPDPKATKTPTPKTPRTPRSKTPRPKTPKAPKTPRSNAPLRSEPHNPWSNAAPRTERTPEPEPEPSWFKARRFQKKDTELTPGPDEARSTWRPKWLQYEKSAKPQDVADAVRSLGSMLATSRGETGPLKTLAEQYRGSELGSAFGRIAEAVQSGQHTMAEGFRTETKVFPKIIGDLVAVGAASGSTPDNLDRAADILDNGNDLSHRIRSALLQPGVLLATIILFLYGVILFVLPVFSTMFASFGKPLPPLSKAVQAAGDGLLWGGGVIGFIVVSWTVYYKKFGSARPGLRIKVGRAKLKTPVIGKVLQSQGLAQVFSILSGLLTVGMSEHDAMTTAAEAVGNAAIKDHLLRHVEKMDRGTSTFAGMADGDYIPLHAGNMLQNGFDSGAEVKALQNVAKTFSRDANRRADNLAGRLEPIANGMVSAIFVLVILAVYLPVYDMFSGLIEI